LGRREDMLPPRRLRDVGSGDFIQIGEEFLGHFRNLGGLGRTDRVLDVGCGIGRMAIPLTRYLEAGGLYEGFDIVPSAIRWCQRHITPRFPHFRFQLADVYNSRYNRRGGQPAASYRFPFAEETFDFAFLTSVFTHMLPPQVERYTVELRRVVRPGGRLLVTFFLLNPESEGLLRRGRSSIDFPHDLGTHRLLRERTPEAAVAYREDWVRGLFERNGLAVREPISWGEWCGREQFSSYQDILIVDRP